ncbi:MAG TPA: VIT1/CCC1 transporter family protein [Ktedonobacterales bacterium]|nr:VIT1/CCC1 transporter family protein [Ktedonobacterales bacterium]
MPDDADIARYKTNLQDERDSSTLYHALAAAEKDPRLAEIYRRLADVEDRHAARWEEYLRQQGQQVPVYRPGWRIRMLRLLAGRFGAATVLPTVTSMEARAGHTYDAQPEAQAIGMAKEERSHARVFGYLRAATRGGIAGATLAQLEGRHRNTGGGNALRAAVLGASDGLTSNMSLVMGVAGANLSGQTIFLTGIAGLLAGALSMAIGEWLSVQSARELYLHQIDIERAELKDVPDEEREELTLIYQAKGLQEQEAQALAKRLLSDEPTALDTLAREELGIDPGELGGSAWQAAITSFLLFAVGAIIPAAPFAFGGGLTIVVISLALSTIGLFIIGAGITLTTGVSLLKAGGRQVVFGLVAAAITFGLGRLVGGALG